MKMADGGYRPAYNVQFSTTTDSQVIVGVDVNNIGSDQGQLSPMLDQVEQRYEERPAQCLVDGGYARHDEIEEAQARGTTVYAPVRPLLSGASAWALRQPEIFTSNAPPPPNVLVTRLRAGAGSRSFWCAG
jgi:hypothetical protein